MIDTSMCRNRSRWNLPDSKTALPRGAFSVSFRSSPGSHSIPIIPAYTLITSHCDDCKRLLARAFASSLFLLPSIPQLDVSSIFLKHFFQHASISCVLYPPRPPPPRQKMRRWVSVYFSSSKICVLYYSKVIFVFHLTSCMECEMCARHEKKTEIELSVCCPGLSQESVPSVLKTLKHVSPIYVCLFLS